MTSHTGTSDLIPTGVEGLDEVLHGGLPRGEMYLVHGEPGTGKTVLATSILHHAASRGERVLCITIAQRRPSMLRLFHAHGWDPDAIEVWQFDATDARERLHSHQVAFETGALELIEAMEALLAGVAEREPALVVFDAISHLRLLSNSSHTYHQQLLALRDFFAERSCTVLLTDSSPPTAGDPELSALVHGVIELRQQLTPLGGARRTLHIPKLRDRDYTLGLHDFEIRTGGPIVQPRLRADVPADLPHRTPILSGIDELDTLVGGGLLTGTSCLFVGPSGVGKTSTASLYCATALSQGLPTSIYLFDELPDTFMGRARDLGMPLDAYLESGKLRVHHIAAGRYSLGALGQLMREDVEAFGSRVVLLDTLTGFLASMPERDHLVTHLHELLTWLDNRNVLSLLVVAQHGVVGPQVAGPIDISYLADAVLFLRHFESGGQLNQMVAVYKKRYGVHQRGIRQFLIDGSGIRVGPLLEPFSNILDNTPTFGGRDEQLFDKSRTTT